MAQRVLVVRGGWDGHDPVGCTDAVVERMGAVWDVDLCATLEVYDDLGALQQYDLVVQSWSLGALTAPQEANLIAAVRSGVGFAGWHGGIVGTFTTNARYLQMVGARFVWHPDGLVPHRVDLVPERAAHPVIEGITDFEIVSEQYWLLSDGGSTVLATSTFRADDSTPWQNDVVVPVVWTRRCGRGRIFVSTIGHALPDLLCEPAITILERGLRWAAR